MESLSGSISSESPGLTPTRVIPSRGLERARSSPSAAFTLFIHNEELDQTVSVTLKRKSTSFQAVMDQLIDRKLRSDTRWRSLLQGPYFLIFEKEHILCLELSPLDYPMIPDHGVLTLTAPKVAESMESAPAVDAESESTAALKLKRGSVSPSPSPSVSLSTQRGRARLSGVGEGKAVSGSLVIRCSFGAPYRRTNVVSPYFGGCSLNQYADKLRAKFDIPRSKAITFTFHDTTCLDLNRKCGIKELGIRPNDEILAETNGIILALTAFGAPQRIKFVEMFEDFTLKMLQRQIEVELSIPVRRQKALIRSGWRLIDHDSKCKQIREYETITVLAACGCAQRETADQKQQKQQCSELLKINKNTLSSSVRSGRELRAKAESTMNPEAKSWEMTAERVPLRTDPECASRSREMVGRSMNALPLPLPMLHPTEWIATEHSAYSPLGEVYQQHLVAIHESTRRLQELEMLQLVQSRLATRHFARNGIKVCNYGDRCKYWRNPHVWGHCRYYHPPRPDMDWAM